ncbi:hypothetical protein GIB67_010413 [Kingdonia uniflora]|uniref:Uncharacterized protein n=1 Tax=Kingdonia uniflora TaxID=39325 RepID=A0A7J7MAD7_9MAGN|nr:hypothetical protein GIB67_010413 [Kingdonia uniflora]
MLLENPKGGVLECKAFHSIFITVQDGLSLNVDVSATMIVQPGPIVNFLIVNLGVRTPDLVWLNFSLKQKNGDAGSIEIYVSDYYEKRGMTLSYSAEFPCINVGKPKRRIYLHLEALSKIVASRLQKELSKWQMNPPFGFKHPILDCPIITDLLKEESTLLI